VQQDVFGLEVSIDIAEEVEVLEGHEDLGDVELDVGLLKTFLGLGIEQAIELSSIAKLRQVSITRGVRDKFEIHTHIFI
jgi:hypothetical protein